MVTGTRVSLFVVVILSCVRACGRCGRAGAFDGEARVGKISQRRAENLIKIGIFMRSAHRQYSTENRIMFVGGFSERVFASYPNSDLVNLKFCVSIDCSTKITQNAVSFVSKKSWFNVKRGTDICVYREPRRFTDPDILYRRLFSERAMSRIRFCFRTRNQTKCRRR